MYYILTPHSTSHHITSQPLFFCSLHRRAPPRMLKFNRISGLPGATEEDQVVVCRFNRFIDVDYERELRLPSFLFKNLCEEEIPPEVILISCLGMWAVELEKGSRHQRRYLSGGGWHDYARSHLLRCGDVMWFEQVDKMVFRTYVFDHDTYCEKRFLMPEKKVSVRRCDCEEEPELKFTAKMKEYHATRNYLNLQYEFVANNACVGKSERGILVNSRGNAWETEVYYPNINQGNFKHVQLRGWHAFYKSNKLEVGDRCVFTLDEQSCLATSTSFVIKVEIRR